MPTGLQDSINRRATFGLVRTKLLPTPTGIRVSPTITQMAIALDCFMERISRVVGVILYVPVKDTLRSTSFAS